MKDLGSCVLRCAAVAAGVVFAFGCPQTLFAESASVTEAYARDGLVAFWDALENQGPGEAHSNSAESWIDVSGHAREMSAYSGIAVPQWTDAGLLFPASASKTKTGLAYQGEDEMIGKDSEVTVEIVADGSLKTSGALFGLFGGSLSNFYSPGLSVFVQFSSEMPYLNIGGTQYSYSSFKPGNQTCPERGNLAITFTRSAVSNECFFYQGRYYGDIKLGAAAGPSAASKFVLGACNPQCTTAGFTGVVHAVRIYNRVLTDKEIARNAELDRMRYYGELAKVRVSNGELQYRLAASVAGDTGGTVSLDGGAPATSLEGWFAPTGADTVLVATPADGYEFVGWSEERGSFLGSETTLSLLRGDYRTVIAHFRKTESGGYTSASYVQKGLLLHFDAIDNAGRGLHAADPDSWTDLTGNGQDATFSTFGNRPAWLANAAMTTNATGSRACYFKFTPSAASLAVANSNGPYTLQYCATSPTTLDGSEILRFVSGGAWGVRYAGSANKGQTYFQVRGNQSNQGTYGDVLTGSTDSYLLLTSGKLQRYVGIAYKNQVDQNVSGTSKTTGGGRIMSTSGPTVMGMHAVRLYDRQLTPFEVAKNARLDRVRFKGGADATRIFSVSPEGDVARGTSTPAYTSNTATESAKGAVIAFSLTGLSTDGFDGQRNVLLETGVRDRFLGWRANGGATNAAESVDYALDDDTDFRWVFVREYFQDYSSAEGGTIAHDGVGCAAYSAWCPTGQVVRLTAVPDEDHVFFAWTGTLDGLSGQEKNPTLDVLVDRPRAIRAVFRTKTHTPRTATWTGGSTASAKDWDDAANWDGEVPGEGDDVVFGSVKTARTIILSHETPVFNSIVVDSQNTLMTSNWFTKIQATTVTVKNGGVITCGDAFKDSQMSNRVWIVCRDLDVQSGGTINVNDKGWRGGNGPSRPSGYAGGAHGGYGAKPSNASSCTQWNALPYGDAESPLDPGEGGSHGTYNGGGAVLVEASGTVTIGGSVKASATGSTFSARTGFGSGGSICIRSKRFKGTGSLTADGAYGQSNWNAAEQNNSSEYSHPGGGGYISVKYDPTVETDDDVNGMTISAAAGDLYIRYNSSSGKASYHRTPAHADDFRQDAGIGQLWFTDNRMLKGSLGAKMTGALVYTNRFEFDSLTVTSGHVRFGAEGCQVNVAGDLIVSGKLARVEIGGYMATNRSTGVELYAGKVAPKLTVGGCLAVADEARLDVRAAETNGVEAYGAWVDVAGHFRIASNSYVYAWCDSFNGGAPRFTAKSLTVETNGVFSADRRGFAAGSNRDGSSGTARCPVVGRGPGGGRSTPSCTLHGGGGHGGTGGFFGESGMGTTGMTNDFNVARPSLAGSGGGSNVAYGSAGHGGGVISVAVERDLVVHGKVTANGGGLKQETGAPGAGGTILLEGKTFSGTGTLTANGEIGGRASNGGKISGCGGGGRIAVWTGKSWIEGKSRMKHCTVSETPVTGMTFSGTATAAGGIHPYSDTYNGKDGTVRYVWYDGAPGMLLFVR